MIKQNYRVTEKAGNRVNGGHVVLGQILRLTESEARYHRDLGEIVLVVDRPAAAPAGKPKS